MNPPVTTWQQALAASRFSMAMHQEERVLLYAPSETHPGYTLVLDKSHRYHARTVIGCERLLQEFVISPTGWYPERNEA